MLSMLLMLHSHSDCGTFSFFHCYMIQYAMLLPQDKDKSADMNFVFVLWEPDARGKIDDDCIVFGTTSVCQSSSAPVKHTTVKQAWQRIVSSRFILQKQIICDASLPAQFTFHKTYLFGTSLVRIQWLHNTMSQKDSHCSDNVVMEMHWV